MNHPYGIYKQRAGVSFYFVAADFGVSVRLSSRRSLSRTNLLRCYRLHTILLRTVGSGHCNILALHPLVLICNPHFLMMDLQSETIDTINTKLNPPVNQRVYPFQLVTYFIETSPTTCFLAPADYILTLEKYFFTPATFFFASAMYFLLPVISFLTSANMKFGTAICFLKPAKTKHSPANSFLSTANMKCVPASLHLCPAIL